MISGMLKANNSRLTTNLNPSKELRNKPTKDPLGYLSGHLVLIYTKKDK